MMGSQNTGAREDKGAREGEGTAPAAGTAARDAAGTGCAHNITARFWEKKTLAEMNEAEWEALCDRCGLCCLNKLEDFDTGRIVYTSLVCELFDTKKCACSHYARRRELVANCEKVTPENIKELTWLPPSCAYRLIDEGKALHWWHHLVSGSAQTVHEAGISVRGRVRSEKGVSLHDYESYVVDWPQRG